MTSGMSYRDPDGRLSIVWFSIFQIVDFFSTPKSQFVIQVDKSISMELCNSDGQIINPGGTF